MTITVTIPKRLVIEAKKRGIEDIESKLIENLLRELDLNPRDEADIHLRLAEKFLQEGKKLIDEEPTQSSEKLYKAVEECVKALTMYFNLREVIVRIKERGRWTVTDLEKAVRILSRDIGKWFRESWDIANYLHVWGFHEAKLDKEAIVVRIEYVERVVKETKKIIKYSKLHKISS